MDHRLRPGPLLRRRAGAADTIQDLAIDFRMNPLDGQVAPAFTLSALDGKRLSLADFKGHVVLLYFWASW